MRIVVNDIAASTGGALSILRDFYGYISEFANENEWIFLLGDNYIEPKENIKVITLPEVKKSKKKKLIFDFIKGRKYIERLEPDVVFSLQNIITFGLKCPQAVYVHQPLPFQETRVFSLLNKKERNLAMYQHIIGRIIKKSAKCADKVIVQTKWMKKAVVEHTGISEERIVNILPEVGDISEYRVENVWDNHKFFYPTGSAIYKNNNCIYEACRILEGRGITDFSVKITALPKGEKAPNVEYLGRIPREQVLAEYNISTLLFPSYIETYGYPMAEARQLGTLVIASDCPFSREVLDGYNNAHFFDPFDAEALADYMEKIIKGKLVPETIEEAKEEQTENSWKQIADTVLSCK